MVPEGNVFIVIIVAEIIISNLYLSIFESSSSIPPTQTEPYVSPKRDNERLWSIYFVLFIFFGSFFIMNLCVGVIIENFTRVKRETGQQSLFLTERQKTWVSAHNRLFVDQQQVFLLRNLHEVSDVRRKL